MLFLLLVLFFVNVSLVGVLVNPDPDALSYSACIERKHVLPSCEAQSMYARVYASIHVSSVGVYTRT
jgi:hypothetical protein